MNNHRFKVPNTNLTFEAGPRTLRIVGGQDIDVNDTNIRYVLQEMLRLAERAKDLEIDLAADGEARENTETRLSGRVAELEGYVSKCEALVVKYGRELTSLRADLETTEGLKSEARGERDELAQRNTELEEETKDLRAVLKTIFALNPEIGEAEIARLLARIKALDEERTILRDRVTTLEQEAAGLEEQNARLKGEVAGLEQENAGNAGYLRKCEIAEADNRNLRTDLAAAIRTGEEQAEDKHILQNNCRRLHERLSRLDALLSLSSENVPAGLWNAAAPWPCLEHGNIVTAAWRWFREQLGAPADKEG